MDLKTFAMTRSPSRLTRLVLLVATLFVIAVTDPDVAFARNGGSDKGGSDKGGSDKGGSDKGGSDKGGSDKSDSDKGGSDKSDSDKGGSDKSDSDDDSDKSDSDDKDKGKDKSDDDKSKDVGDDDFDERATPIGTRLSQDDALRGVERGEFVSLRAVLKTVRRRERGDIISVDLVRTPSGKVLYDIVLLSERRELLRICVDAARNRIVSARGR